MPLPPRRLAHRLQPPPAHVHVGLSNRIQASNSSAPYIGAVVPTYMRYAVAPRLRTYLTTPRPVWRDIVDTADWLRGEMGISRPLWGEACVAMGRECAAVAVALVSARPAAHFRTSPGGYFHGMVAKAKAGELNLNRVY